MVAVGVSIQTRVAMVAATIVATAAIGVALGVSSAISPFLAVGGGIPNGGGGGAPNPASIVSVGNQFVRGNANDDEFVDIGDAVYIINHIFLGSQAPLCMDAADVNDTGKVDISDPIYLISAKFLGGPNIPPPYPALGVDVTPDTLGCKPLPTGILWVSVGNLPVSQSVIVGTQNFEAAQLVFDASASVDSVAVTGLAVRVGATGALPNVFGDIELFDGMTKILTNPGAPNCSGFTCAWSLLTPSGTPWVVPSGTVKVIRVVGDVSTTAGPGSFAVSIQPGDVMARGVQGGTVDVNYGQMTGNTMSLAQAGALTIAGLTQNHPAGLLPGNTNGLEVGVFRLTAIREPIRVEKIYLSADSIRPIQPNGSQASALNQVRAIHLYDGATRLTPAGGVIPTSTNQLDRATVLIDLTNNPIVVPLTGAKDITVKVDTNSVSRYPFPSIGAPGQGFRFSIAVSSDVSAVGEWSATRLDTSSVTLSGASLNGFTVYVSVPTVTTNGDLGANKLVSGILAAGSNKELYRFKVAADSAGDVYLFQVGFMVSQQKATLTNPKLKIDGTQYAATTSVDVLVMARTQNRRDSVFHLWFTSDGNAPTATTVSPYRIAAGASKIVSLYGDVACWTDTGCGTANGNGTMELSFLGDDSFPATYPDGALQLSAKTPQNKNRFIWGDMSISGPLGVASGTATIAEQWTNGYRVRSGAGATSKLNATTTDVTFTYP